MVNWQINREAEFYNASCENNRGKKVKSCKREENFFAFLVYYFFNYRGGRGFFCLLKSPP